MIMNSDRSKRFILWFEEVSNGDVGLVGGKNASLGEIYVRADSWRFDSHPKRLRNHGVCVSSLHCHEPAGGADPLRTARPEQGEC